MCYQIKIQKILNMKSDQQFTALLFGFDVTHHIDHSTCLNVDRFWRDGLDRLSHLWRDGSRSRRRRLFGLVSCQRVDSVSVQTKSIVQKLKPFTKPNTVILISTLTKTNNSVPETCAPFYWIALRSYGHTHVHTSLIIYANFQYVRLGQK